MIVNLLRQGGEGGSIEEFADGDADAEAVFDASQEADDQKGVAAQGEEIILHARVVHPQQCLPDGGQRPFDVRFGAAASARWRHLAPVGLGQGAAVDLALGGEGQFRQGDERGRDHVGGEAIHQPGPQGVDFGRCFARENEVRGQADVLGASGVAPRLHHSGLNRGMLAQHRGDLAQFNTIPADLDLMIAASQVLKIAVGRPAGQVPGAVEAGAGDGS